MSRGLLLLFICTSTLFALCSAADYTLPHSATCTTARDKYLATYTDIAGANLDAVYHYQNSGGSEGRTWDFTICDREPQPIFPDTNNVVACTAAITNFTNSYPWLQLNATSAYPYWIANYLTNGVRWRWELCTLPNPWLLFHTQTCTTAREQYLTNNPDVAGARLDPVYHFQTGGGNEGRAFNLTACASEATPLYPDTNTVFNCTAAATEFVDFYTWLHLDAGAAWGYWIQNYQLTGVFYHYELCETAPPPAPNYTLPHAATCVTAREAYLTANPDVDNAYLDPVYHYQNSGGSEGRVWNLTVCGTEANPIYPEQNDIVNCTAAINEFIGKYTWLSPPATAENSYTYWKAHYYTDGTRWKYELCNLVTSTSSSTTASSTTSSSSSTTASSTTSSSSTTSPSTSTSGATSSTSSPAPTSTSTTSEIVPETSTAHKVVPAVFALFVVFYLL